MEMLRLIKTNLKLHAIEDGTINPMVVFGHLGWMPSMVGENGARRTIIVTVIAHSLSLLNYLTTQI